MATYLPRLRVSAYVICQDEDARVLLARWVGDDEARWTLPGGGLDHGEPPEQAALRELTEETGYTGRLDTLLGIDSLHDVTTRRPPEGFDGVDFHALRIVYLGSVTGGRLTFEVGGSTDRAEWFTRAEIADLDAVELVGAGLAMLDEARDEVSGRRPAR